MEQLTQLLKNGNMEIIEVPMPVGDEHQIIVKNYYSAISIGTEGKTVSDARKGLIAKALSRKNEVKKVIQSAKTLGIKSTWQLVSNKLESPNSLGYSCCGEVIAVGAEVKNIKVGDFVACGGNTANHASYVQVPSNLAVKLKEKNKLKEASITTLGAIAMQGLRQAELQIGETALVIGLGLIGQITLQLLNAAGIRAIGVDINTDAIARAHELGFTNCFSSNDELLAKKINDLTNGNGVDGVIITASASTTEPIELAGQVARRRANIVIVGAVPTGFERANFFKKELNVKMSCSYGPGRYDANYEIHQLDYPIEYVRWTENRNMQAFIQLLEDEKLNIGPLVTHEYEFKEAINAYDDLMGKKIKSCAVVLKYDVTKIENEKYILNDANLLATNKCVLGLIGAGNFAQNFILPNLKNKSVLLETLATNTPINAENVKRKFNFKQSTCHYDDVITNNNINTVFIATRHNTHGSLCLKAIANNKHVFVEKPLCISKEELSEIKNAYQALPQKPKLIVGFNRRFAPLTTSLKKQIDTQLPCNIIYRINAGQVDKSHWTQDVKIGGGRLIGEVCHFIDYCYYLVGHPITYVHACTIKNSDGVEDSYNIALQFANSSVANIVYTSLGNKLQKKEYIEVFQAGRSFTLNDFTALQSYSAKLNIEKLSSQDKGHAQEIAAFIDSINQNTASIIPIQDIFHVFDVVFACIESIKLNEGINITI